MPSARHVEAGAIAHLPVIRRVYGVRTRTAAKFRRWPLLRFISYVRPHAHYLVGATLTGICKFTLPLLFPISFKYIVDVLLVPRPHAMDRINALTDAFCRWFAPLIGLGTTAQDKLVALTIAMFIVYLAQAVVTYFRGYWAGIAGNRLIFDLRLDLYSHLHRLSCGFFDRHPPGGILARVVNDVDRAQELIGASLIDVWMDAASFVLVIGLLFALDYRLALISLVVIPLYVALIRRYSPRIKRASHGVQETIEAYVGELQERISGAATVKAFCRENAEQRRFREHMGRLYDRVIEKVRLASSEQMLAEFITRATPSVIVLVAALLIMRGTMTVGTVVAFIGLLGYIYLPLQRFAELSIVVSTSQAAIERIFAFFDELPEVREHPLARPIRVRHGIIDFDHVHFAYRARRNRAPRTVLHDINLHVRDGARIALVGRSGAGKSTLASLIPRFYDVSGGRLLIDGKDVRHITLRSLRAQIGIVTQETMLFSASVREILRYGRPDADEGAMWRALERASLRETVEQLPGRLDAMIGERGQKFSTGQRQRLALARAFLKDPAILILDEATAAVDAESENLIHEAASRLMEGRTSILIAHRLRSAVDADLIAAIDAGRITEIGTHRELLRRGGVYARLYAEQTRGLGVNPSPPEANASWEQDGNTS